MMPENEVKNRVRALRFEHGEMTQAELADKVGVTRQTIIAIEAGKYLPSLPLAFKLARTFGLGVEDLFQYKERHPKGVNLRQTGE
ncbi:MAG TPA: helix-turn-helix transcriptional regulator [archaeon]|nr:helix-turn-helix transcriptional regulator [archaeon]